MAKHYNPGFAYYDTYYKSIENLPIEQQKEICYAYVKYGITYEMVDPVEMPLGYSFVLNNQQNIINSVERWIANQNKANQKIDSDVERNITIARLIKEGLNSNEIAKRIGDISSSAIRKSAPWKDRNNADFDVKWLGKSVNNSQNGTENICESDVNLEQQSVNNSQNGTGNSREISHLYGAAANM